MRACEKNSIRAAVGSFLAPCKEFEEAPKDVYEPINPSTQKCYNLTRSYHTCFSQKELHHFFQYAY